MSKFLFNAFTTDALPAVFGNMGKLGADASPAACDLGWVRAIAPIPFFRAPIAHE